jgi:hypothetical protein
MDLLHLDEAHAVAMEQLADGAKDQQNDRGLLSLPRARAVHRCEHGDARRAGQTSPRSLPVGRTPRECPRLFIVDVNYQAGTSEPVRADAPIVVGPKEKVIMLSPGLLTGSVSLLIPQDQAADAWGCRSSAPMMMSHSMMASSPNITGKTHWRPSARIATIICRWRS